MKFTVYKQATGEILRCGRCSGDDLALQAKAGEVAIEGEYPRRQYYWSGSAMVTFPAKPSETASWDWSSKSWQVDLTAAKAARWEAMKKARQEAIDAPLVTPYGIFDSGFQARDNIAKTAQGIQTYAGSFSPAELPTVEFTLWDDSVATLSAQEMIDVAKRLFVKIQAAYSRGREVRQAIESASSLEEIESISWL